MLARDFSWYLEMDINLLRLDAANYAFKEWGTPCYGLPEVTELMNILYRSMDDVSPRMVPNLEVNDKLGGVMRRAFREIAARAELEGLTLRRTAFKVAIERVVETSRTRGYID